MMKLTHTVRLAALAVTLACVPAAAAAQADATSALRITIRAHEGGQPLPGANVELLGLARAVNADSAGVARFPNVPAGPLLVQIRKFGYGAERFPVNVPARDTVVVEVDLQTEAVRLAEIRATARTSPALRNTGFYERQRIGVGSYAMRSEWAGRGRLELGDVVRRMRGIRVARTQDGRTLFVPSRPAASIGGACSGVQIYVDNVPLLVDGRYDDVHQLISLAEVEAVETYSGPSEIPPQYNATGSACAVVLVWRSGVR
ncbi:MAG TPA: carboxypeptidase-like regulatory domain-containing protein [Longimicrobium sp.]|nr:carboxypeptidase-like regulatory domain-containing protein [Longimicrobium sp.]